MILGVTRARGKTGSIPLTSHTDRLRHVWIIGATGTGKSELTKSMAVQDLRDGVPFAYLDPHGQVNQLVSYVPKGRQVAYLNPNAPRPVGINPLDVPPELQDLVASQLAVIFRAIFGSGVMDASEDILRNAIHMAFCMEDPTLLALPKILTDFGLRRELLPRMRNPIARGFFEEYNSWKQPYRESRVAPILGKLRFFLSSHPLRYVLCQKAKLDIQRLMDEGGYLFVNLNRGVIGEKESAILGSLIIGKILQTAMMRRGTNAFYLYCDESPTISSNLLSTAMSEARKFNLGLILVSQYAEQYDKEIYKAIIENAGTKIVFKVGGASAFALQKDFHPMKPEDMTNLPSFECYIRLMKDGTQTTPFTMNTLPLEAPSGCRKVDDVLLDSRERFGREKSAVEEYIRCQL